VQWSDRWLLDVEFVRAPAGPLVDRTDDLVIQSRLFE
jgi:hypothetical protein